MNTNEPQPVNGSIFKVLWFALLMSCCMFTAVVYISFKGPVFSVDEFIQAAPLSYMLFGVAVANFILSSVMYKMFLKPHRGSTNLSIQEINQKYFVPFLVKIVLLEACTIFGLVLSFGEEKRLVLPFFIISVVGFMLSIPSESRTKRDLLGRAYS